MALFECKKCHTMFENKFDLSNHLKAVPGCKAASYFNCSTCRAAFPSHQDLKSHLYNNRHCKTIPKSHQNNGDRSLLQAMEKELNKSNTRSGLESSILSMVAEGDNELLTAYSRLEVNPTTEKKNLTKEFVQMATRKAKFDLGQTVTLVSKLESVSICFVMDTTGNMGTYISSLQKEIVKIVKQVEASGCYIAGLAFVGYKDGNLHSFVIFQ